MHPSAFYRFGLLMVMHYADAVSNIIYFISFRNFVAFTKISSKVYGKVPLVGQSSAPDGVEIQPMDLSKYASKGELREVGPATVFAYAATEEAMRDAGFSPQSEAERDRTGNSSSNILS